MQIDTISFGQFIRERRETLGKSIRGMAAELDITPSYLSDIEKGNRYAPENYLAQMEALLKISEKEKNVFYDLAGKDRNDIFPDLKQYISEKPVARVALRKARDLEITDGQWEDFINGMDRKEVDINNVRKKK